MTERYRMADEFELPVKHGYLFESPRLDLSGGEAALAVYAINTHDAMQDRIKELEQERDQLKAQNAELQEALTVNVMDWVYCGMLANDRHKEKWAMDQYKNLKRVVNKSPATCLAEIQVKAIENLITEFNANYYGEELSQWLEQQADKLRQKAIGE